MKKIAFVCVNYGLEIVGGAQTYTRLVAEQLSSLYDVEVLTSKAIDTWSWANHFTQDEEVINNVLVRRFEVEHERNESFIEKEKEFLEDVSDDINKEEAWLDAVGPKSTKLIEYIKNNHDKYLAIIFVTYEYYHSIKGIPEVKDKAIFIPTAHDCKLIRKSIFQNLFNMPKAFVYLTEEERTLCNNLFHNDYIMSDVLGVGVEIPENINDLNNSVNGDYILYIGRYEPGKGINALVDQFIRYKDNNNNDLKLVTVGSGSFEIPNREDIINKGFVSDEEKFVLLRDAKLLVLPSMFESLSMVVLEAMASKTPFLVHEKCDVLKGHCLKSNGGFYYETYEEFESIMNYCLNHKNVLDLLGENCYGYFLTHYSWKSIKERFSNLINMVGENE